MQTTAKMKMVNGRVRESAAAKASRVLEGGGLTISSFIRNSIEHIASTGEVPECGLPSQPKAVNKEDLRDLVIALESKQMPGKASLGNVDDDGLVDHLRMERYGY